MLEDVLERDMHRRLGASPILGLSSHSQIVAVHGKDSFKARFV